MIMRKSGRRCCPDENQIPDRIEKWDDMPHSFRMVCISLFPPHTGCDENSEQRDWRDQTKAGHKIYSIA
jgi:hypothetical protein